MGISLDAEHSAHANRLFVGGEWQPAAEGATIEVVAPFNEEHVATVASAGIGDVDRAMIAARAAFDEGPWPRMQPAERAAAIQRVADEMERRAGPLAKAFTDQVGMPLRISTMSVGGAVGMVRYFASLAATFPWEEVRPSTYGGIAVVVREPVGVAVCIAPWNAPLHTMLLKCIPALLAGCAVIAKPSPETPLDALLIAECAEAAGLPDGVFSVLPAHRDVSDYLMRHPSVDKVSFTGSTAVGQHIAASCGGRMVRYTMELGGKSAAIVLDDMPADQLAPQIIPNVCLLAGQQCAALSRILVPRHRRDEFAQAIAAAMQGVVVGDPYDDATLMGPLIARRQLDRVSHYIAMGERDGGRIVTGGKRPAGLNRGFFIEPTLFTDIDNTMTIAREEIFGPVVVMIAYDTEDEAIRIANDSPYGLSGSVHTPDAARAYAIGRRIRTGNFTQNGRVIDYALPYGGFKLSGSGREGGPEGIEAFCEIKTIAMAQPPAHLQPGATPVV